MSFSLRSRLLSRRNLSRLVRHRKRRHVRPDALHLRIDHVVINRSWSHRPRDARRGIGPHFVVAGDLNAERGKVSLRSVLREYAHRQIALNGMQPKARLVAMMLDAPCKDAYLVVIERQSRFER